MKAHEYDEVIARMQDDIKNLEVGLVKEDSKDQNHRVQTRSRGEQCRVLFIFRIEQCGYSLTTLFLGIAAEAVPESGS